jgi:hypothetical protein
MSLSTLISTLISLAVVVALVRGAPLDRKCTMQFLFNGEARGAPVDGLCVLEQDCADGHFPTGPVATASNKNQTLLVTGCKVGVGNFPPGYECCARSRCFSSANATADEGVCVNSAECGGTATAYASSAGAIGCFLHKASVLCCVGPVNPTTAPTGVVEPYVAPTVADTSSTASANPNTVFPTTVGTGAPSSAASTLSIALALAAASCFSAVAALVSASN